MVPVSHVSFPPPPANRSGTNDISKANHIVTSRVQADKWDLQKDPAQQRLPSTEDGEEPKRSDHKRGLTTTKTGRHHCECWGWGFAQVWRWCVRVIILAFVFQTDSTCTLTFGIWFLRWVSVCWFMHRFVCFSFLQLLCALNFWVMISGEAFTASQWPWPDVYPTRSPLSSVLSRQHVTPQPPDPNAHRGNPQHQERRSSEMVQLLRPSWCTPEPPVLISFLCCPSRSFLSGVFAAQWLGL